MIPAHAEIEDLDRNTIRANWNGLLDLLDRQLPQTEARSEFTPFAETTADFAAPLSRVTSYIHILRQTETYWDSAFQLYSGALFLQR